MNSLPRIAVTALTAAIFCSHRRDCLAQGTILISEVAMKGNSNGVCEGNDWVELFNLGEEAVSLLGYRLHDDKGMDHAESFVFPSNAVINAKEYLLLCTELVIPAADTTDSTAGIQTIPDPMSPQFGIGNDDTITLLKILDNITDSSTTVSVTRTNMLFELVDSVGPLPKSNIDTREGTSYALDPETGLFNYTSTATPGAANLITPLLSDQEYAASVRAALKARNELGTRFFGMDDSGYPVQDDSFPIVMDLHLKINETEYSALMENAIWEVYQPFQTAVLKNTDTGEEVWSRSIPGRIRTKGQSTLYMGVCMGTKTIPFQLDLSTTSDDGALDQTLFGAETVYLRHHMGDYSFMRDHFLNRMLARFGLPHVRARKVQLYINDQLHGFYTLLEAPDQDYVFARSFPDFDVNNYALYKVKSFALGCGAFTQDEYNNATVRMKELDEQATPDGEQPKYNFERGEHRPPVEELGAFAFDQCFENFLNSLWSTWIDVVVAYERHDQDCGDMLVEEDIVDLDLGNKDYNKEMKDFLNDYLRGDRKCQPGCAGSNLKNEMDVEQALRTIAFYAAMVVSDSPIISGNNYYLANSGDGTGWKFFPYDFNQAGVAFCEDDLCNTRAVHWSIARPTCHSLEDTALVGPLLSDPDLHQQYLVYVEEFLNAVMTNTSLIEEMQNHAQAIDPYVRSDIWSVYGAFFDLELSPDSPNWEEHGTFPLLPMMKARAADLRQQFAAIDSGTFPRGPHVGVEGDNEPWEPCAVWYASEANRSKCELGCQYDGCHMPDYAVPSYCNEVTGKCYSGDYDEQCSGLYDFEQYVGMEDTEDGRKTFCRFASGSPTQAAECPAVGASVGLSSSLESDARTAGATIIRFGLLLSTICLFFFMSA